MGKGAQEKFVFKVIHTPDLTQQPPNSSLQTARSAQPTPPPSSPAQRGPVPYVSSLIYLALELAYLGLNPEPAIYSLCDLGKLLHLSVPRFLHLKSGGDR